MGTPLGYTGLVSEMNKESTMNQTTTTYPTTAAMLTNLLVFPAAAAAVASFDFGRAWTPGATVGETVEALRAAGLIHRALQVAMVAAQAAACRAAFEAGAQSTTASRAAERECRRLLPPRPRGAEPTPHVAAQLASARAMGWVDGRWVG